MEGDMSWHNMTPQYDTTIWHHNCNILQYIAVHQWVDWGLFAFQTWQTQISILTLGLNMCPLNLAMDIAPLIAEQNVNRWRTLWYFSVREVVQIYLMDPDGKTSRPSSNGPARYWNMGMGQNIWFAHANGRTSSVIFKCKRLKVCWWFGPYVGYPKIGPHWSYLNWFGMIWVSCNHALRPQTRNRSHLCVPVGPDRSSPT